MQHFSSISVHKLLATSLLLALLQVASAQQKINITGQITDSTGKAVIAATIKLQWLSPNVGLLSTTSNNMGKFYFEAEAVPEFKLSITHTGYANFTELYHYPKNRQSISLPTIVLSSLAKTMQEVVVMNNKTVTIKEDTLEFKADSFKVRPDADVEDLLKKIPGIQVDANGNITAYGKSITKIRVNGKDFFSGDIRTATKELPANIIGNVQVIDDYGDQAAFTGVKDGDPSKIINLNIKKDKNKGYFGRGQVGYGTDERYNVNGSLNHFNNNRQISVIGNFNNTNTSSFTLPGRGSGGISGAMRSGMPDNGTMSSINTVMSNGDQNFLQNGQASSDGISNTRSLGINIREDIGKKLSVYGSYTFSNRETITESNTQQTNLFTTGNINNNTFNDKTDNSTNHRLYLNAEWKIDSFNQIKFSPSISLNQSNTFTRSNFNMSNSIDKLNDGQSTDDTRYNQPQLNGTFLYNHRFKKAGRLLSANVTGGYNTADEEDDRINNSTIYSPAMPPVNSLQHQQIVQANAGNNYSGRLSYTEPLSRQSSLELNLTHSSNFTSNDRQTYLVTTNSKDRLDSLSNVYENTFSYQRLNLNYKYNKKKLNYSIGMAVQQNSIDGKSFITSSRFNNTTFNWFPQARLTYNFTRTRNFTTNYNVNISSPTYNQLQPIYDYSNPQFPVIGNPNLLPAFQQTLTARYTNFDMATGNILFTNISFTSTRDKVVTNAINKAQGGGTGSTAAIQETQYLNANGYHSITGFYNFSKPFKKRKYVLTLNGNLSLTNDPSFINSIKNNTRQFIASQGFNTDIRLKSWLEAGAGFSYTYNETNNKLTPQANTSVNSYTLSSNGKLYLPKKWIISYDLNKSFNSGFGVSANPFIINGYLEKQFTKNNALSFRLQIFDALNQNTSISRTVNANSIIDSRTNRLGRYLMLSFNFKLQKFKGKMPKVQFPQGPPPGLAPGS